MSVPFGERRGLAFVGNYGHSPNVDAAWFLAEAVMPLVWQLDSTIECFLIGGRMPALIRRLGRPGLHVIGQVAEMREILDRVRLTVAPLRYGAGVKGKVLASFAAEGLALPRPLTDLCGDSAPDLAERLHSDEDMNYWAASAGLSWIAVDFSDSRVEMALRQAIGKAGAIAQCAAG